MAVVQHETPGQRYEAVTRTLLTEVAQHRKPLGEVRKWCWWMVVQVGLADLMVDFALKGQVGQPARSVLAYVSECRVLLLR